MLREANGAMPPTPPPEADDSGKTIKSRGPAVARHRGVARLARSGGLVARGIGAWSAAACAEPPGEVSRRSRLDGMIRGRGDRLHRIFVRPLPRGRVVFLFVRPKDLRDLGHERIVGVGIRQQGADGEQHL